MPSLIVAPTNFEDVSCDLILNREVKISAFALSGDTTSKTDSLTIGEEITFLL